MLLLLHNEPAHLLISLVFVPCGHGMQLQRFHIHPTLGTSNFIFTIPNIGSMLFLQVYRLLHHMPQERYRNLLPYIPWCLFLNSKVSLYPAAPRGLVPSSLYEILRGIWIPTHAIAISIFMLDVVILSLPHCSFSLWKHFISISLVHNCTWCCTILHTLQYSVVRSFLPSFFIFPAPSVPSVHFKNAFSFLS